MSFITKQEAEEYLREYYNDNFADDEDYPSFESLIAVFEDMFDMIAPELVYAYWVYTDAETGKC